MLKSALSARAEIEMAMLEQLVTRTRLLRLIDEHIRSEFIGEKTEDLYCANNGRPAIDPVMPFKMQFISLDRPPR